ncbi:hypothetical protein PR048_020648 [Dryococelus australis]|uniref:Uncharacterized protein n=1 Tax=Dryococelus australis TaxID=614101 RepID=A0ABQ9H720_9NEOP|nr:hypothetical protein PR048_020648 [Dryococelus australis]
MSAYIRQKAKSKYRNRMRLERASQKEPSDINNMSDDRVKRCRERKIIKTSGRVNSDVFAQNKRLYSEDDCEIRDIFERNIIIVQECDDNGVADYDSEGTICEKSDTEVIDEKGYQAKEVVFEDCIPSVGFDSSRCLTAVQKGMCWQWSDQERAAKPSKQASVTAYLCKQNKDGQKKMGRPSSSSSENQETRTPYPSQYPQRGLRSGDPGTGPTAPKPCYSGYGHHPDKKSPVCRTAEHTKRRRYKQTFTIELSASVKLDSQQSVRRPRDPPPIAGLPSITSVNPSTISQTLPSDGSTDGPPRSDDIP